MIIDTNDPATLDLMNPLERQVLRGLSDRLSMQAWQRQRWGSETGTTSGTVPQPDAEPRDGGHPV